MDVRALSSFYNYQFFFFRKLKVVDKDCRKYIFETKNVQKTSWTHLKHLIG